MKFIISFLFSVSIVLSNAQLNVNLSGHIDLPQIHDQLLNDVWGYEDEFGNEYVLAGGTKGTSVVDISDPSTPIEIFYEPGMESIWRDLKTYGDYAYVTTEAQNGLLIIDLSPLPSSTALNVNYYTGPAGSEWQSAHNLYIDELGYVYIFGANRGNGGVIILDVTADPMNPVEVGVFDNWYVHDGYVQNDTLYCAHISDGFLSVVDIQDRSNPQLLGTSFTPSFFTHNIWADSNGIAYTTDEVSGGYVASYDVSDPSNIVELDRIQSSPGAGVVPHNVHVLGNYLITSWYSDGIVIHDATHPHNLIEVGYFDTHPLQTTGYEGCWGAYPFFSSGLIAATDRQEGLFILSPDYIQGAYLEGIVTDLNTGNPIDQVNVELSTTIHLNSTDGVGFYACGSAQDGPTQVIYSKVGYYPDTVVLNLTNGVVTVHDVQLVPIPPFNLKIIVREEGSNVLIEDAQIELIAPLITHQGTTNGIGEEDFSLYYEDVYAVHVGKWGQVTYCNNVTISSATAELLIFLRKGFYDDFTFDFSWTTTSNATTGHFERGVPFGTDGNSQTDEDVLNDCGDKCYVTGNAPYPHPDIDDVDDGTVTLRSPVMDLTSYTDPYVNYSRWFYCMHGATPNDELRIYVDNGLSGPVEIDQVDSDPAGFYNWVDVSKRISDYVAISSSMQFIFETSDLPGGENITEAAIDHFYIAEGAELGIEEVQNKLVLYPNPVRNELRVIGFEGKYQITDASGKVLLNGVNHQESILISVEDLSSGLYFLLTENGHHKFVVEK
jgi:choice-of-anchor B domain-containing protein